MSFKIQNGVLEKYEGTDEQVVIPEGVTSIGREAFGGCRGLLRITLPESVVDIGARAFYGCHHLTNIELPEGLTKIGADAFYNCYSLTSIAIPESVTSIGRGAFWDCSSLTSIALPKGLTSIGGDAFSGCSNLTGITIFGNVEILSPGAISFSECARLTKVALPDALNGKASIYSFRNCKSLCEISLSEGIDRIAEEAFLDCTELREITLPSTVEEVGPRAFAGCSQLRKVVVKGSLKKFASTAFQECPELREVYFAGDDIPEGQAKDAKRVFGAEAKLLSPNGTPVEVKARAQSVQDQEISKKIAKVVKPKQLSQWVEKRALSADDVRYANSEEVAPGEAVLSILYAYMRQQTKLPGYHAKTYKKEILPFKLVPEADAVAGMLDLESLRKALAGITVETAGGKIVELAVDKLSSLSEEEGYDIERWNGEWDIAFDNVAIILPYCRYAGEEEIKEVITIAGSLQKQWCERGYDGRKASIIYRSAILLSDTKAAMDFAKKDGNLELYAEMRGTTPEALYKSAARKSGSKAKTGLNSSGSMGFEL